MLHVAKGEFVIPLFQCIANRKEGDNVFNVLVWNKMNNASLAYYYYGRCFKYNQITICAITNQSCFLNPIKHLAWRCFQRGHPSLPTIQSSYVGRFRASVF